MKHLSLLFFLSVCASAFAQRKAVFIIVDGIPADVIEKLKPPVLEEIAGEHGYTRAFVGGLKGGYSESPTISAVGYNHVLTGTWANKHNVWDNDIKDPNYHYWNVFRLARAAKPGIKTAVFSTWLDNRTKLVGDGLPAAGNVQIDYAFDGFEHDTLRFPHLNSNKYISDIDEHVATEAARTISEKAPDLSWVYLEFTDDMGHQFGDSPQLKEAVLAADARIGIIWRAVQARQQKFGEDWLVIITTDHGRTASDGKGHGGQTERERTTWIVTNAGNTNRHFQANPGAVDIAPTLMRHLEVVVPDEVRMEMDGIPFIGKISLDNVEAIRQNNSSISLTWRRVKGAKGPVDIWMSSTNHFARGGKDEYQKIATVKIQAEQATVQLPTSVSPPKYRHKLVLKAAENWCNIWVVEP